MKVDYYKFIAKGEFGNFKFGIPNSKVIEVLGNAPLYKPQDELWSAIARYDCLEFIIDNNKVIVISLQLDGDYIKIPKILKIENFETPILNIPQVEEIIKKHDVTWERLELMCDDRIDYYFTSTGVHLSFAENKLGKVGAANPNSKWGE